MLKTFFIATAITIFLPATSYGITVRGHLSDASTQEPLGWANVSFQKGGGSTISDADGKFIMTIPAGSYILNVTFPGYTPLRQQFVTGVASDTVVNLAIEPVTRTLGEITVTARENSGMSTASRIDRDAMDHIQPTSFTDLLSLIPGGMASTPEMGKANIISLRETGNLSATGVRTDNDDYSISSLGTMFIMDGAPVNNDSGIQGVPFSASGEPESKISVTNKGVDMRTIPTDNIESVEIVRGIPSAEYGNLTSGLVNIRRTRKASPLTARFKADEYSKLFSVGKGFALPGGSTIINVDAGFLNSKSDPRDNLQNYRRLNLSARGNTRLYFSDNSLSLTYGIDYTGSFDNTKKDPDLNYNKIDVFKNRYNRMGLSTSAILEFDSRKVFHAIELNASFSYVAERMHRIKQVAPQRATVAPTSMSEGVSDGTYLLSEYIADYTSDGQPLNFYLKIKSNGMRGIGFVTHSYKIGADWNITKNLGKGQIYDLSRPLSASWTTRPRSYREIPAIHTLSFYAEDNLTAMAGSSTAELQLGVRTIQLPSVSNRYYLSGKVFVDPRANAIWKFPEFQAGNDMMRFSVGGGFGITTKMPTADYLYPQNSYSDFIQLNYYDTSDPDGKSRVSLRTYINDAVNYSLRPARNRKWELRAGASWGQADFSVTYFEENMTSGFRYSSTYAPYSYTLYDASAINSALLEAPPELSSLPSSEVSVLNGHRKVENGSRLYKRGIEFQLRTPRWNLLRTALTVNGAWFKTLYSNSMHLMTPVSDVVENVAVSDRYVGIYDTKEGRVNSQFNTNFMFDTQITRWGLVFSTSVECMWNLKTRRLRDNGIPSEYISSADGKIHEFYQGDYKDPLLAYLVRRYNDAAYIPQSVPPAVYINLKATKKIGKWLRISAFVNHIIDYLPDYRSNGLLIRRSSEPYFGMEMNLSVF